MNSLSPFLILPKKKKAYSKNNWAIKYSFQISLKHVGVGIPLILIIYEKHYFKNLFFQEHNFTYSTIKSYIVWWEFKMAQVLWEFVSFYWS